MSDVYLGLYLARVTYKESPDDVNGDVDVDDSLYVAENYFGGTVRNNPGCNSAYCMAYLELGATNFDTDLIIKTENSQNLDAGASGRRVYTFYYELRLEVKAPAEALIHEKGVFPFQVRYYKDRADFYQCELVTVTYYTGSNNIYDIYCLYDNDSAFNKGCWPDDMSDLTIEENWLTSIASLEDPAATKLSDSDDFVHIKDISTSLYGTWEILFTN